MSAQMQPSDEFEKLKQDYKNKIPEKIQEITKLIETLKNQPSDKAFADVRNWIHKLAGNAGSFGYNSVSVFCKEWDRKLTKAMENTADALKNQQMMNDLSGFVSQLSQKFQNPG